MTTPSETTIDKEMSEQMASEQFDPYRELGERLTAGLLGVFDLFANLGHLYHPNIDAANGPGTIEAELRNLRLEIQDLRQIVEEMQNVISESTEHITPGGPSPLMEAVSGRASREVVIDRIFKTATQLIADGQNISEMASTSLAHAAGVKPTQFTYAFKTRAGFDEQFALWQQQVETDTDASA